MRGLSHGSNHGGRGEVLVHPHLPQHVRPEPQHHAGPHVLLVFRHRPSFRCGRRWSSARHSHSPTWYPQSSTAASSSSAAKSSSSTGRRGV